MPDQTKFICAGCGGLFDQEPGAGRTLCDQCAAKKESKVTEKEVYSYLMTAQKIIRYMIQTGVALGLTAQLTDADNVLTFILGSSAVLGVIVGIINILKHKFKISLSSKWLKWLPLA